IRCFEQTCEYIRTKYPEIMIIADAKRGDIGNTSEQYAKAFFDTNLADAVTLSPYMGYDTVAPFLKYEGKWSVILALTSNPSAEDFEMQRMADGRRLYELVLETTKQWGDTDNTMYVVGATKAFMLEGIRSIVPDHFLLVPGVGAQGGSLRDVAAYGMNSRCGLLVNSSRGIIYADRTERYAEVAGEKAREMQAEMSELLDTYLR
ncbi:MAG: orotidine-5'-phosphate decarboxylase, partial [Rikenellaceae bacterium]|nr:orotidine-5'-phosphate decarboxylase [Rikenellaceae bacterium]